MTLIQSTQERSLVSLDDVLFFTLVAHEYHAYRCPDSRAATSDSFEVIPKVAWPCWPIHLHSDSVVFSFGASVVRLSRNCFSWGCPRVHFFIGLMSVPSSFPPLSLPSALASSILKPAFPKEFSFVPRSVNRQRQGCDRIQPLVISERYEEGASCVKLVSLVHLFQPVRRRILTRAAYQCLFQA